MKIGFIGAGNMGGAIIGGIVKSGISGDITVSDKNTAATEALRRAHGICAAKGNREAAERSDVLFLAVKPKNVYEVIEEIRDSVSEDTVVISIVAGQSLKKLESAFQKPTRLIRVMPNTPALVGESMSALCRNDIATDDDLDVAKRIFGALGRAECVEESVMDAVTAVSGSSPAYVFMMIEAMADAAVMGGLPRGAAYTFAAQAVMGSAKMVLETGKHPGELKDMVCSPAGTTIEAVKVLEESGFRAAIIKAMEACREKSKSL